MPTTDPDAQARILAAYRDAELELIRLLRRALAAGNTGTATHYADTSRALQAMIRQAEDVLRELAGQAAENVIEALRHSVAEGFGDATLPTSQVITPVIPDAAITAMATELTTTLVSPHRAILRQIEDTYRAAVGAVASRGIITGVARTVLIQDAINQFATRGITPFRDAAGRVWNMDTYAEMALRTSMNRARNAGRRQGFADNAVTLIVTSSHRASAPQCVPYQGKILSLDGKVGPRIVTGPGGQKVRVVVTATLEDAEEHGYHHVNCRHVDTPYAPGVELPATVESTQAEYDATQRQRAIERNIRKWKRREAGAITPGERATARAKVKEWQAAQRAHVKAHPDLLTRRYDRERLYVKTADARPELAVPRLGVPAPPPSTPLRIIEPPNAGPMIKDIFATLPADRMRAAFPLEGGRRVADTLAELTPTTRTGFAQLKDEVNPGFNRDVIKRRDDLYNELISAGTRPSSEDMARYDKLNDEVQEMRRRYGENCPRVSVAFEMRRRGYDVHAGATSYEPRFKNPTTDAVQAVSDYSNAVGRRRRKYIPWSNSDSLIVHGFHTEDGSTRPFYKAPRARPGTQGGANMATLLDVQDAVPDGATGFAKCRWSGKDADGHIWNWVKRDGKIEFFEAQTHTGFIPPSKYLDGMSVGTLEMVRVDDLHLADDVLDVLGAD